MYASVRIAVCALIPALALAAGLISTDRPCGRHCVSLCDFVHAPAEAECADMPTDREQHLTDAPEEEPRVFGGVRYFSKGRRIEFDGHVLIKESGGKPMELIACTPGGKTHESVFAADIKPSDLHAALLEAGMRPWSYTGRQAADRRDLLGDRAIAWMEWNVKNRKHRVRAEDMLLDTRLSRPIGRWGWAFAGQYGEDIDRETGRSIMVYRPNREKSLITNYHSPNSVLDNPRSFGAFDEIFVANSDVIPDIKTHVTLIIEPVTEERLVRENLQTDLTNLVALRRKLETASGAGEGELGRLRLYELRIKWLKGLVQQAAGIDALRLKIRKEIEPAMLAKAAEVRKAIAEGDRDLLAKLNSEGELLEAQMTIAWKAMEKEYHYYYKSIAEGEAEEGKLRNVDEKKQAVLEGEKEFYNNKEKNVENELKRAGVNCERLQAKQALGAVEDGEKRLEIQIRLAQLNRDDKVLKNKIETFHLQPEIENVRAYIKAAEMNIADALKEGDEELAQEYRTELKGYKATLKYYQDMTRAKLLRAESAKLECMAEIQELRGEKAPDELLARLKALDMTATLAEKRARRFELQENLRTVTRDLKLEVEIDGDPKLIRQLRSLKTELEKGIHQLDNEIRKLEENPKDG